MNPDHLQNQVEGAVVMGLGGALFEAIEFDDGQDHQPALLALSRAALHATCPRSRRCCSTARTCRPRAPGETPIIAMAPAVAGAIFAATGTRRRSLPLVPKGVSA